MKDEYPAIKDFIYLDWERIRSLASQLFKGVPGDVEKQKGHEIAAEGKIEGSLPLILKAKAGGDYRYFKTESETRSFHHYVYSLVEESLLDNRHIKIIDENFNFEDWVIENFKDGEYILGEGILRLMDYSWISSMLKALPRMMKTAQYAETLAFKQRREAGDISPQQIQEKQKEHQRQSKEIKDLKLEEFVDLIKQLYGDVVRIKLMVSRTNPEKVLVGTGVLENFNETQASLSQKYGYEVDANWRIFGQINISASSTEPKPIPIGNEIEDRFEEVALTLNQIVRISSSPKFPAISITPISIYRIC